MYNLSSAMARQFVEAVEEMTIQIHDIGPNPLKSQNHQTGD